MCLAGCCWENPGGRENLPGEWVLLRLLEDLVVDETLLSALCIGFFGSAEQYAICDIAPVCQHQPSDCGSRPGTRRTVTRCGGFRLRVERTPSQKDKFPTTTYVFGPECFAALTRSLHNPFGQNGRCGFGPCARGMPGE